MHITDDTSLPTWLQRFLRTHATRGPRTSVDLLRREARALRPDGRQVAVPEGAVERMVAFEERCGGLSYVVPGWPNSMEYGVDGDADLRLTPLGWAFYGVLDGRWTAPLDVLLDGRVTACLGSWPQRVVDDTVEQRLAKHALFVELADRVRVSRTLTLPTGSVPELVVPLPSVVEASGGADAWWRDEDTAVWMQLDAWPQGGPDVWTITCAAATEASARSLLDAITP